MIQQQQSDNFTKAKPFIKWVGGKSQLIASIQMALPENFEKTPNLTYIEPFVGGGAVLFRMLEKYRNIKKAVINDINPDLITAYLTVRDHAPELVNSLQALQNNYFALDSEEQRKDFFLLQRERYNQKNHTAVENTTLFFFLNRTCYNGLYRVNSKGGFNVPFGKYIRPTICDASTIMADSALLQKVEILQGDFAETLNLATANSFFYFDPPYKPLNITSSFTSYTKGSFDDTDQHRLKQFCDSIHQRGYRWLLSNSDVKASNPANDFFDSLYANYKIERVWASRSINANPDKRGKLTELLISNY